MVINPLHKQSPQEIENENRKSAETTITEDKNDKNDTHGHKRTDDR